MVATLLALIPRVFLGILSKMLSEKLLSELLTKLMVYGLEKLAANTENKLDDDLVKTVIDKLNE